MSPNFESFLKQCDQSQLLSLITEIESRLGTDAEQPGDLDRAQAIAHQINNLLAPIRLRQDLAKLI